MSNYKLISLPKHVVPVNSDKCDAWVTYQLHATGLAPASFSYNNHMSIPLEITQTLLNDKYIQLPIDELRPFPKLWIARIPNLRLRPAGVFAAEPIKKGACLGYLSGETVDFGELTHAYTFIILDLKSHLLDLKYTANWTRFLNGSTKYSNVCCPRVLLYDEKKDEEKFYIAQIAKHDIAKGEQLLIKYGWRLGKNYREMGRPNKHSYTKELDRGLIENPEQNNILYQKHHDTA